MHMEETELVSFEEARKQFERDYLARLLKITSGNVAQAARLAKRNRTEFYKLLQRHQLDFTLYKQQEKQRGLLNIPLATQEIRTRAAI